MHVNNELLHVAPSRACNTQQNGLELQQPAQQAMQQTGIKALALRVLASNSQCNRGATSPQKACNKAGVSGGHLLHGISEFELQQVAGNEWPEIKDDPETIKALAHVIETRHMRERGEIPAHYTTVTLCKGCGPVPIFEGVPDHVEGCPWCFNRVQGRPVPKGRFNRGMACIEGRTVASVLVVTCHPDDSGQGKSPD
jgi:hypothetical protein